MATPPKKPTSTTPPRRKAAARKATPPAANKPEVSESSETPVETPKKAPAKRAARGVATKLPAAPSAAAPAKPRTATKRAAASRGDTVRKAPTESTPAKYVADTREKLGDRNFFAAVLGATAALGAAVAGIVLALRSGKAAQGENTAKPNEGATAHQVDGADSSAQFEAGIADENMIPDKLPNT
jgi:hypothetical protein